MNYVEIQIYYLDLATGVVEVASNVGEGSELAVFNTL